jgi:diguanylate cyclase (GGDEF)-like protein
MMQNILLIEDSKAISSLLKNELEKLVPHCKIFIAHTYKEALKIVMQYEGKIDASILDLHLPDAQDGKTIQLVEQYNIKSIVLSENLNENYLQLVFDNKMIIECIPKEGKQSIKSAVCSLNRILKNKNKNVLIVDDSKMQLNILKSMLLKMNLCVDTVSNGQEALDLINNTQKQFYLVLTDYHMPQMDGMELTLKLRQIYDKDTLSIIVISSNNTPEIAYQFLKIGANDFINKPLVEMEVITRVNANLDLLDLFTRTKDLANKDFLTGAYNRRYFFESGNLILKKAIRNKTNLAFAMIDIDKFKNINDTYGHDVGDIVICKTINFLNSQLRESDLIARFGGEEFAVLLENISLEDTRTLFSKIQKVFEENILTKGEKKISFTVSIGVSYGLCENLEDMIKNADLALYHCKKNGRNQVKVDTI